MPIVAADILLQSSQNPGTIWRRAEWSLPCSARFTSLLKHYAKRSIFAANRPYYRGSSPTVNPNYNHATESRYFGASSNVQNRQSRFSADTIFVNATAANACVKAEAMSFSGF